MRFDFQSFADDRFHLSVSIIEPIIFWNVSNSLRWCGDRIIILLLNCVRYKNAFHFVSSAHSLSEVTSVRESGLFFMFTVPGRRCCQEAQNIVLFFDKQTHTHTRPVSIPTRIEHSGSGQFAVFSSSRTWVRDTERMPSVSNQKLYFFNSFECVLFRCLFFDFFVWIYFDVLFFIWLKWHFSMLKFIWIKKMKATQRCRLVLAQQRQRQQPPQQHTNSSPLGSWHIDLYEWWPAPRRNSTDAESSDESNNTQ